MGKEKKGGHWNGSTGTKLNKTRSQLGRSVKMVLLGQKGCGGAGNGHLSGGPGSLTERR